MAIIGQDNRTEVTNLDQNPFDSVVAIDGFQTGGEGSGILLVLKCILYFLKS